MRSNRHTLTANAALLSATTLFQQVSTMLAGFFVARLLGPHIQGIWQTARLFATYSDLSSLGQGFGMRREAAVSMGRNDYSEITAQRDTGFTWNTLVMLMAAAGIAVYATWFVENTMLRQGLWGIAAALCVIGPSTFFSFWYKTIERFGVLSLAAVAAGISALAGIPLIFLFGFPGAVAGFVITAIAMFIVQAWFFRERIHIRIDPGALRRSLSIGIPLWMIMVSTMLFTTIDRIVVITQLGFTDMGFYSISTMFFLPLETAVGSLAVVLLPRVCRKFGEGMTMVGLGRYFIHPLKVVMTSLPGLAAIGAACIPFIVRWLLPQYESGILPAQIMLIGLSFSSAAGFCHNILVAAGKPWWLFTATAISFAAKLIFVVALVRAGLGLTGVAMGAAASMLLRFVLQFALAARVTRAGTGEPYRLLLLALAATVGSAAAAWCWSDHAGSPGGLAGLAAGGALVLVTSFVPAALQLRKLLNSEEAQA